MRVAAGPRWCLEPEAMAAVDRAAIEAGLPGLALMECAGRSVARTILDRWPRAGRAVVLVGGGRNGGDGLVVARWLDLAGWRVELALFADPAGLDGDAAAQWRLVAPLDLPARRIERPADAAAAIEAAAGATCIVDALLGTGLAGDVREPLRTALVKLDPAAIPVFAVDIPSGLDGATGRIRGAAPRAAVTVTFGFPQPGHFLGEGPERCGSLIVTPLGYPRSALAAAGPRPLDWIGLPEAQAALPPRRHDLHKGAAGRLLVLAGSAAYPGAAVLCAAAALRSGAGLCVVATPEPVVPALLAALPEAIVVGLPVTRSGRLAAGAADRVAALAGEADAIAIGPGLTTGPGVRPLVEAALSAAAPAVVDADGLNVLADDPTPVAREPATVATPHPGELGRWLGRPAGRVDGDRVAAAHEAARRWRIHVLLKGSPTVVADPDGRSSLNLTGNPGLATGGSGDVLTGLVGSLLAQGIDPRVAARAAPFLHGLAADRAAAGTGQRGLVPSDLVRILPLVLREVAEGRGAELIARLDLPYGPLLARSGDAA